MSDDEDQDALRYIIEAERFAAALDDDEDDLFLDADDGDEEIIDDDEDDDFIDMDEDDDEDEDEDEDEDDEENGPTFVINVDDDGNLPDAMGLVQQLLSQPESGNAPGGNQRTFRLSTNFLRHLLGSSPQAMRAVMESNRQPIEEDLTPWWHVEMEGNPVGKGLLDGGEFGTVGWIGDVHDLRTGGKRKRAASRPEDRCEVRRSLQRRQRASIGTTWPGRRRLEIGQETVPNSPGTVVAQYPSIPYIGQYSHDYETFYTATQSFTLHLYSTKASRQPQARGPIDPVSRASRRASRRMAADDDDDFGEDSSMRKIKTVQGVEGRWTVTDAEMSRDGRKMIYSSITPFVHMLDTAEHESEHVELDFTDPSMRTRGWGADSNFGIWSVRFSADGKEIVAGCGNGKIMVYDIAAQQRILSVPGHADDVNAVCFADENSTNILVSGSDDGYVKVWDRRSLSSSTPSGVLVGATEGITYVSPKGDGRYVIANSKDQAARLYDLRKMRQWQDFKHERDAVDMYGNRRFDYRHMGYAKPKLQAHPQDSSIMTYRGHAVLSTLIRCHFSPDVSTGQSYIYSGSADGMIHIWSLDGRVVQVLNRANSIPLRARDTGTYSDPSSPDPPPTAPRCRGPYQSPYDVDMSHTVRDVSWHGLEPTLMSTSWESEHGYRRGGTLAKHEWKGLGKNGLFKLEDWVEREGA